VAVSYTLHLPDERGAKTDMSTLAISSEHGRDCEREEPAAPIPNAGVRLNGHVVIFFLATVLALVTAGECHAILNPASLLYGSVLWIWWAGIASAFWKLGKHVPFASSFSPKAIFIHLLIASTLGIAHLLLLGTLGGDDTVWRASLFNINRFGIEVLLYGFVFGITGTVQFQIRAQSDALKSLELQRQLSAAHLRALQMQLEPHFLFNTLNAITTLVELGRQKEAAEMLSHLNAILKSTLKRETPDKVPLSQELENVENYLAIEQVRFADRLRVEIKVDPGALDGLIPCFLLQPIVENAIRHGIAHCENEGRIEASAKREGGTLQLRVRDSGPGLSHQSQSGHGIGLRNTRDRLTHFYQNEYAMQAAPLDTGGFEVSIRIPYERSSR
jgi:signal transduction histidine kinase